jgi:hypothetical protein
MLTLIPNQKIIFQKGFRKKEGQILVKILLPITNT